jgi:predicted aspartyl protease
MSSRPYFLISIFAALALTMQMSAWGIRPPESAPATGDAAATIRFDLYQGYFMVVHGSVGPLKNLNFFVDTGTSLPVLDSRIATRLKLQAEGPSKIVIMGGRVRGQEATLPLLEFGPVRRSNLEVITADLSFFQKAVPVRIDAIVGLAVLGQSPFMIDYTARVIRFGVAPALPVSVPLRLDGGLAVFDAEIDSKPVHLLFDTGASSLILFVLAAPQGSQAKVEPVLGAEAIGNFESKQVRLRSLRLGAEEFRNRSALVARNPKPSQLDFDGLMSPVALGISRVSVDLEAGVLGFSR